MEHTPEQLAAKRAFEVLGGIVNAAIVLAVPADRYQTLQSWARNRVPAEYCPLIERETASRGSPVRCEELRPDVKWSVLRKPARRTSKVEGTDRATPTAVADQS